MAVAAPLQLVGRDEELERVSKVASFAEGARAVLIRGEAGMGKTSLWQEGVDAASAAGVRVLRARGVESEMQLGFAVLTDLLDEVVPRVASDLSEPQRLALGAALGGAAVVTPDPLLLPRAVLASFRLLAERGPLLVAVDDAQWVDRASARVLAFVLRRTSEGRVATLATLRGGATVADPMRLAEGYGRRLDQLELAPLSIGALQRLLRLRLGLRLPRLLLGRVQRASGGNPMFALEFGRAAAASSTSGPLPVPASLQELVRSRVERLPQRLLPLLELVAVLERPTVSALATPLGGIERTLPLVDAAVEAEAVVVDEQDLLRFTHPLLAVAVYGRLTPPSRRRLHRRAAQLVEEPELRARHHALGSEAPDGAVVALLDDAAQAAAGRGAPDAAAELLEHAERLTPEVDPTTRQCLALRRAQYLAESSQSVRAAAVVDQVLLDDVVPSIRAEVLVLRANLEDDALVAVDFLSEAVDYCGDDRDLRVRILLLLAERHSQELGDLDRADRFVGEAGACAEGLDDAHLRALILKWAGMIASLRGSAAHELAWAAVELEQEFPPPFGVSSARAALALQLGWAGELEEARALLEKTLAELSARGMEFDRAWQLPWLAEIELRQGDLDGAYRHAREVEDLFDPDHAWGQATVNALHARLAVHSGAADEARRLLLDALDHAERTNLRLTVLRSRWLLGFLELSRGDPAAAWRWLGGLADELDLLGIRQPGVIPVLPDAIETLVELGEVADAERLLQRLDAQAAALGHRWALAAVARSRALLLLARQKTDAALDQAEESASQFAALGIPLDQARALLVAGGVLRRRGERRRAAEALASAAAIFERVGAHLWLDRAREERARADPHPGRKDALTPAEQRVATLVAAGRTNREVAAQLYITVATVEAHLTRIYRKLDVRSRAELARRFALQPDQTHISG